MNNTQEQATQCHRHGKEFKQWWSTAKDTLKCDEGDAMEIWLASRHTFTEVEEKLIVNWKVVDKKLSYIAMDKDGGWRGYTSKPHTHIEGYWTTGDVDDYYDLRHNEILNVPFDFDWEGLDWKTTLFCHGE